MNAYQVAFEKYVREHPLNYGDVDIDSLLEMFYWCYAEDNLRETEDMIACFREIDRLMAPLTLDENDTLFHLICQLCIEKEKAAFLEGFRAGGQWMMEMRK